MSNKLESNSCIVCNEQDILKSTGYFHSESQRAPTRASSVKFQTRVTKQPPISKRMRTLNRQLSPKRCRVNLDLRIDDCRLKAHKHAARWLKRCVQLGQISAHNVLSISSDINNNNNNNKTDNEAPVRKRSTSTRPLPRVASMGRSKSPDIKKAKRARSPSQKRTPLTIPKSKQATPKLKKKSKTTERVSSPSKPDETAATESEGNPEAMLLEKEADTLSVDALAKPAETQPLKEADGFHDISVASSKKSVKQSNTHSVKHADDLCDISLASSKKSSKSLKRTQSQDSKCSRKVRPVKQIKKKSSKENKPENDNMDVVPADHTEAESKTTCVTLDTESLFPERRARFKSEVERLRKLKNIEDVTSGLVTSGDGVQNIPSLEDDQTIVPEEMSDGKEILPADYEGDIALPAEYEGDIQNVVHELGRIQPEITASFELYGLCFLIAATTACLYNAWSRDDE